MPGVRDKAKKEKSDAFAFVKAWDVVATHVDRQSSRAETDWMHAACGMAFDFGRRLRETQEAFEIQSDLLLVAP